MLAWDLNERMGGVEVSFGRVGSLVVGCNLGQSIEAAADRLEESPFGVFFREDCLNEMRELRDDKVNQRKVAQSPLLSSNEFLKLGQLASILFQQYSFFSGMIGVEEKTTNSSSDFIEY